MFNIFRKRKPATHEAVEADYTCVRLIQLSHLCGEKKCYDSILPSAHYELKHGRFCVRFDCYHRSFHGARYTFVLSHYEKLTGKSLSEVLKVALAYTATETAFIQPPDPDWLPDDINFTSKNITLKPRQCPTSTTKLTET